MANNFIYIVLDSCRFDTFAAAATPNIDRLGDTKRCYAFASWTMPSHAVYLMGASPHANPRGVYASEVYKQDFASYSERLGIDDVSFNKFIPQLSLPAYLKSQGYRTNALVSMPVLNQTTILNQHFDSYQLMDDYNDFDAILDELVFYDSTPSFYLLNTGETHYPYTIPGESVEDQELLYSSDRGVFKHRSDDTLAAEAFAKDKDVDDIFFMDRMNALKDKQQKNVEYLDGLFERLYDIIPANTHIIVTSDHGEVFGEGGYFGHGPVFHEKVYEIFFVEGKLK